MSKFETYIENLAQHEKEVSQSDLGARESILVNSGIRLNWLGDFLANSKIKYSLKTLPVEKILFTGTNLDWNEVLIDRCQRSVLKFRELVNQDGKLKKLFEKDSSYDKRPLLVRPDQKEGYYLVVDGMHRFVGAVLAGESQVQAFVPLNLDETLPVCEPHIIYDLIRGYIRNAKDEEGKKDLYHALRLLLRTYANAEQLLRERFNSKYVDDEDVQEVIGDALA